MKQFLLLPVMLLTLIGCSTHDEEVEKLNGNHVWKEQTDTLKQARGVEEMANQLLEDQKKKMDELNRQ